MHRQKRGLEVGKNKRDKGSKWMVVVDGQGIPFKMINDTYGHQCGDYVLKQLVLILNQNNRACDYICRYGGEEFTILLPDTKLNEAVKFAERNRVKIQEEEFVWENKNSETYRCKI